MNSVPPHLSGEDLCSGVILLDGTQGSKVSCVCFDGGCLVYVQYVSLCQAKAALLLLKEVL